MPECTRCGWTGPAATPNCPRCGQSFAPAGPPPRPTLVLKLEMSELPEEEWEVTDTRREIGRLDDSDITIPHKSVSRKHAEILPTATGFEIEDLGSTNGTYLNDQPISDRTPLSNNDLLMIGDVPVRVVLRQAVAPATPVVSEPRWPQPQPQLVVPEPRPLPAPERPTTTSTGPSTVYYDLDEALAQAQPPTPPDAGVPTAWDVKPARAIEAQPAGPTGAGEVEQPTLVGAEVPAEPAPPPPPPIAQVRPTPPPPPIGEVRLAPPPPRIDDVRPAPPPPALPRHDVTPLPYYDPRPAPPREVIAQPARDPRPALDPLPTPARDPLPTPAMDPLPSPPRELGPEPVYEPRPTPREVAPEPRPAPREVVPEPRPAAAGAPQSVADLSATDLIQFADQLTAALRRFKGDASLALWLFDHAGGEAAARAFVQQVERARHNPDNPDEQARLLEQAPSAARLLESAILLANVVSSLGTRAAPDNEVKPNATDLEPVARA